MSDTITAYYERKLSDGNYGSEGFSLGVTLTLKPDELIEEVLTDGITVSRLHTTLATAVLERLAASSNGRVSFTAQRELHAEDQRAEAWANSNASAEERAIRGLDAEVDLESLPF